MEDNKNCIQAIQVKLDEIRSMLGELPEWKRENIIGWLSRIEDTLSKPQREDLPGGHLLGPNGEKIV